MKIATHVLLFGQDKWIMRNIENAYPHVDRIYIAYSDQPWVYNPAARGTYKNTTNLDMIRNSKFSDKITIIEGVWNTEEEQRNACVDQANADGMDYLIIHDADEFYHHNAFEKLLNEIRDFPDLDYYKVGWICFWKTFEYCLIGPNNSFVVGYPEFAINLKKGIRFQSKRRPTSTNSRILSCGLCYHGSYVLTNEELLQKINTWGHTNDFDKNYWYNEKWLKWTPEMTDLHLVTPSDWKQATLYSNYYRQLPEVIKDMV